MKTYFYKVVELDIPAERARIAKVGYKFRDRQALMKVCDCLERHNVKAAFNLIRKWPRERHEFMGVEIFKFLRDSVDDYHYYRLELQNVWAKRDLKGEPS
jgi:hypothetical protein